MSVETIFKRKKQSKLVQLIKQAIREDYFLGIIVTGRQQIGKTRYTLRVAHSVFEDRKLVYKRYGLDYYDAWELTLYHTKFDMIDLLNFLEHGKKKMLTIWDDAGVHASKYLFYTEAGKELTQLLQSFLDLVGTTTNVLIITTPSFQNLLYPIRTYPDWIRVRIYKMAGDMRVAKIYRAIEDVSGKMRFVLIGEDKYNLREGIPEYILIKYYNMRTQWAKVAIARLKEAIRRIQEQAEEEYIRSSV